MTKKMVSFVSRLNFGYEAFLELLLGEVGVVVRDFQKIRRFTDSELTGQKLNTLI